MNNLLTAALVSFHTLASPAPAGPVMPAPVSVTSTARPAPEPRGVPMAAAHVLPMVCRTAGPAVHIWYPQFTPGAATHLGLTAWMAGAMRTNRRSHCRPSVLRGARGAGVLPLLQPR